LTLNIRNKNLLTLVAQGLNENISDIRISHQTFKIDWHQSNNVSINCEIPRD